MKESDFAAACKARSVNVDTICRAAARGQWFLVGVSKDDVAIAIQKLTVLGGPKGDLVVLKAADIKTITARDSMNGLGAGMWFLQIESAGYGGEVFEFLLAKKKDRDDLYSKIGYLIS